MLRYIKYFMPSSLIIIGIYISSIGSYYPTIFLIGFSLFIVIGDMIFKRELAVEKFSYTKVLDMAVYINLPLLAILMFLVISIFGNTPPYWFTYIFNTYLYIDIINMKESINTLDKISLIAITSLFTGILGTVPGHELTHRKKNKFDMFVGNWMLAFSWDCAFAIEHVYGHHKNVCLPEDPATARRGENLYGFIFRAIVSEQRDAWKIEMARLKIRGCSPISVHNRMLVGYLRSLTITSLAFIVGGVIGMLYYLLFAFLSKSLLEAINYSEHYGLVRERGKPVCSRHSWNSNHLISSITLCNVTRHSSHHEASHLKFWELDTYPDAPMLPQGYLGMLYIAIFLPPLYHKMMAQKLIDWDANYATDKEQKIALIENKNSGIPALINSNN